MDYILARAFVWVQGEPVQAQLQGKIPTYQEQDRYWDTTPFDFKPDFTFAIDPELPLLDNYFTGMNTDLYSLRFIEILQRSGVRFESFPANIVEQKSDVPLDLHYYVFHLLDSYAGIDMQLSVFEGRHIRRLVPKLGDPPYPMYRDTNQFSMVIVRQSLKETLEAEQITGCRFTRIDEFRL